MGYEFFGEKIIFPSAPVPGANNDQSLTVLVLSQSEVKTIVRVVKQPTWHAEYTCLV